MLNFCLGLWISLFPPTRRGAFFSAGHPCIGIAQQRCRRRLSAAPSPARRRCLDRRPPSSSVSLLQSRRRRALAFDHHRLQPPSPVGQPSRQRGSVRFLQPPRRQHNLPCRRQRRFWSELLGIRSVVAGGAPPTSVAGSGQRRPLWHPRATASSSSIGQDGVLLFVSYRHSKMFPTGGDFSTTPTSNQTKKDFQVDHEFETSSVGLPLCNPVDLPLVTPSVDLTEETHFLLSSPRAMYSIMPLGSNMGSTAAFQGIQCDEPRNNHLINEDGHKIETSALTARKPWMLCS